MVIPSGWTTVMKKELLHADGEREKETEKERKGGGKLIMLKC